MKVRRLPSGQYNCRVVWTENGKRHEESFTYPTREEALLEANKFKKNISRIGHGDLTVSEAVSRYIDAKSNVLSPATIRSYKLAQKHLEPIGHVRVKRITTDIVQTYINTISAQYSAKYVKNVYGVLTASVTHFNPDIRFRVTLPKQNPSELNVPITDEVYRLLDASTGWLNIAIQLAGFCSMRRGEIAALKHKDIDRERNLIFVHADLVRDTDGRWIYKETPKTSASFRYIDCPSYVIESIPKGNPEDYVIGHMPNIITDRFVILRNKLGINVRFHDLRAFFASSLLAEGLPSVYVAKQGGWDKNSPAMRKHYERIMRDKQNEYRKKASDIFSAAKPTWNE